jgi:hypothetical protein
MGRREWSVWVPYSAVLRRSRPDPSARIGLYRTAPWTARYDDVFPLGVDVEGVERVAVAVETVRGSREGFDIAVVARPGDDLDGLAAAGATWAMHAFWPGHRPDQVLRVIKRGRPG